MKTRLQALGLLDRSIRATSDDELVSATEALDDDHKEAVERLVGGPVTPEAIREAVVHGRMNGTMESIAMVLSDAALADCNDKLGQKCHYAHSCSSGLIGMGCFRFRLLGPRCPPLSSNLQPAGQLLAAKAIQFTQSKVMLSSLGHPMPQPLCPQFSGRR